MDLHGQIMNLPKTHEAENAEYSDRREAYASGHRDARHAAAELAIRADAAMLEAANIIKELCRLHGHPTPDATLARLIGGGQESALAAKSNTARQSAQKE